ncbi:MAG: two-component system sensor histidine kinase NtrB [Terriglobales bacterium]
MRLSHEVLRHLPSGVVLFNAARRVVEANPAACAALGYSELADPCGLTVAQLLRQAQLQESDGTSLGPAVPRLQALFRSLGILQRKTLIYVTPAGEGRRLGITVFPLRGAGGRAATAAGLICLLTDLTAIHALEEELQRRRSLSALGEMAAGIAHEFRNGLAVISGYGQMLRSQLAEPARSRVVKILERTDSLSNIATGFLSFARPLPLEVAAVPLAPILHDCVEAVRMQGFSRIQIVRHGRIPAVLGDADRLRSVFLNLASNAREAVNGSGRQGRVLIHLGGGIAGKVRVLVEDNGPGVAPEIADKIFVPFFTTKTNGTGLGLAMVHKIVTAHRGSVLLLDSTSGHTVFEVLLPAVR